MHIHQDDFVVMPDAAPEYSIRFPRGTTAQEQDEEWFEVHLDGEWERFRIHDYDELYKRPGLYEALVYEALKCSSPVKVAWLLAMILDDYPQGLKSLRVLDLGAGNGIVGARLRRLGVEHIVAVDLLQEAAAAARRDRPAVYDDYLVADLCDLTPEQRSLLDAARFNCMITVAALGFGDVPPRAFATALNCVSSPGWLAMAIKEDFLTTNDSGFSRLVRSMVKEGVIEIHAQYRYCHRLSMAGEQLFYVALVARKLRDIPALMLQSVEEDSPR